MSVDVLPSVPVMPTIRKTRVGWSCHAAATSANARRELGAISTGTDASIPGSRSAMIATAPRAIASPMKAWPSVRDPVIATNRSPGFA
jgi:hypothetical protein